MRAALIALLAALLGVGAAGLLACGGSTKGGIPASRAGDLKDRLQAVRDAVADGKCDRADTELAKLRLDVERVPASVRRALRERLNDGVRALDREVPDDCAKVLSTETTDTTETPETVTEAPTTTAAPPATTQATTPAPTVSTSTSPAPPPPTTPGATTTPNGTGGISPDPEAPGR
jgi:hypothetical protein